MAPQPAVPGGVCGAVVGVRRRLGEHCAARPGGAAAQVGPPTPAVCQPLPPARGVSRHAAVQGCPAGGHSASHLRNNRRLRRLHPPMGLGPGAEGKDVLRFVFDLDIPLVAGRVPFHRCAPTNADAAPWKAHTTSNAFRAACSSGRNGCCPRFCCCAQPTRLSLAGPCLSLSSAAAAPPSRRAC